MPIETLSCPNCGAPLLGVPANQASTVCLYCDSSIRLDHSDVAAIEATCDEHVSPETIRHVKQLLLTGQRDTALQLYATAAGVSDDQAAGAVAAVGREITLGIIFEQQLSPIGILLLVLWVALTVAGAVAGAAGALGWPLSVAVMGASTLLVWPLRRGVRTTLRYWHARPAPATVLRLARIGEVNGVHTFRVLLEVRPPGAVPFQTHMNLPVRSQNLSKLDVNTVLQVKYRPGDPSAVVFDRASARALSDRRS